MSKLIKFIHTVLKNNSKVRSIYKEKNFLN